MNTSQEILSQVVTWSKYASYLKDEKRRENWHELCQRNKEMHIRKYPMLTDEINHVYDNFVETKKVLPSMRSLQFGGFPIELTNSRMFNCAFVAIDDIAAFWEIFFLSLGGTGCGFSVQRHHVEQLPIVQGPTEKTRRFLIGDSIEGWSDAIKVLMKAYFHGKSDPVFDYRGIRTKGTPIKSGGKAPGPDPLRICIDKVRSILNNAIGRKLEPIEAHDIVCVLSDAVLAGGVRRSALISLFSHDDMDMLTCKSGPWWELNPQRGRANNSVVLKRGEITEEQFKGIWKRVKDSGAGEPGFFWTNDLELGTNPCLSGNTLVKIIDEIGEELVVTLKELIDRFDISNGIIKVQSYNVETGKIEFARITDGAMTRENTDVIKLTFDHWGAEVIATPDHKFFTKNRGWIEAKDLTLDDVFVSTHGLSKLLKIESSDNEDVYDITVEDHHSFFANNILVHNCCEISLNSKQFCNLTIINAGNLESQEDYNERAKAASFLGTLQAGYTDFHYLRPEWKEITEKEALLGVSMTGIAAGMVLDLDQTEAANIVLEENSRVAKIIGINEAARTTTIKPEGSTSVVLGTSSGIHAWHNDYYIRRVRVGKNEALYSYMVKNFPEIIEDCQFKPHLEAVMSFPQKAPEGAITRDESALDFLERVKTFNLEWIQPGHRYGANYHNVSCTASIRENEWEEVGQWLWDNQDTYTGISVLPYDNGTYVQAPFENCDKETYESMLTKFKGIDIDNVKEEEDNTVLVETPACAGGVCELV